MDDVRELAVADRIYGGPNGIYVLAQRVRDAEIPGFTIPPELMEVVTGRETDYWHQEWKRRRALEIDSPERASYPDVPVVEELATLGPVLFRHDFAERSDNLTQGSTRVEPNDFHADGTSIRPAELLLHVQGKVVGATTRDVYLATVYVHGLLTALDEPGTDIVQHVRDNVKFWNRKAASGKCEIHVGSTGEGVGTVFSNIPQHQTAHLFTGNGGWTRFREIVDRFPTRSA